MFLARIGSGEGLLYMMVLVCSEGINFAVDSGCLPAGLS